MAPGHDAGLIRYVGEAKVNAEVTLERQLTTSEEWQALEEALRRAPDDRDDGAPQAGNVNPGAPLSTAATSRRATGAGLANNRCYLWVCVMGEATDRHGRSLAPLLDATARCAILGVGAGFIGFAGGTAPGAVAPSVTEAEGAVAGSGAERPNLAACTLAAA